MTDAEAMAALRELANDGNLSSDRRVAVLRGALALETAMQRADRRRRVRDFARALIDAGKAA